MSLIRSPYAQDSLISPMRKLGLITAEETDGLCNGITAAFIIAALSGSIKKFFFTMRYIEATSVFSSTEDLSNDKSILVNIIDTFKKKFMEREGIKDIRLLNKKLIDAYPQLSSDEQLLVDVISLFSVISVFQTPTKHSRYLLNKKLKYYDLEAISKIICHKALEADDLVTFYCKSIIEKRGLSQVYIDEMINTPMEWCGVLEELRIIMENEQHNESLPQLILYLVLQIDEENNKHSIGLYYDNNRKRWMQFDANNPLKNIVPNLDDKHANDFLHGKSIPKNLPPKAIFNNGSIIYELDAKDGMLTGYIKLYATTNNPRLDIIKKAFAKLKTKERLYLPSMPLMLKRKAMGRDLLLLAIIADDVVRVKQLANLGIDLNQEDKLIDYSPLQLATLTKSHKTIRMLTKRKYGIDLNYVTTTKESSAYLKTAAYFAAVVDEAESLDILARAGADLQKANKNKNGPLHMAASLNSLQAMRVLTNPKFKVNLNEVNTDGNTAACIAVSANHLGILKILADAGADLYKTDIVNGWTPLHIAIYKNSIKAVKLLKQRYKFDLNLRDHYGQSPAYIATAIKDGTEIFKYLADHGADLTQTNKSDGYAPIHVAAKCNRIALMDVLINQKYKVNLDQTTNSDRKETAAYIAARYDHDEIIKKLAANGADLQKTDAAGQTPLHAAINNKAIKVTRLLLQPEYKLNLNQATNAGETPVFCAASTNQVEVLELLAKAYADLDKPTNDGITPLHIAAKNGHIDTVKFFIGRKVNLLQQDNNGHSALYYAVTNNHWDIVKLFVQKLNFDHLNREDKELVRKNQCEITWFFYKDLATSTKETGTSPIVTILKHSSSLYKKLENNMLIENRHRNSLQNEYDKRYGVVLYRPR